MNNGFTYCLVSAGLIGASVYTSISCKSCKPFIDFHKTLSGEQKKIHQKIVEERMRIYVYGLVLGLLIAVAVRFLAGNNLGKGSQTCLVLATALFVQYMFYTLYPKSDYMILHLNKDQLDDG